MAIDVSRLATGLRLPAPTGIERWELGYAKHSGHGPGIWLTPLGPRSLNPAARDRLTQLIENHWFPTHQNPDQELEPVLSFLRGETTSRLARQRRAGPSSMARVLPLVIGSVLRHPAKAMPDRAVYLHASMFRLERPDYFEWLKTRPDVKALFVIHDLLPLSHPHFFPDGEGERHHARIATAARHAAALITPSETVAAGLRSYLVSRGHRVPPVHILAPPVEQALIAAPAFNLARTVPYFIACGTIEPRKNYPLLLRVWKRLSASMGDDVPRLIIAGRWGWKTDETRRLLEDACATHGAVQVFEGLSDRALGALIKNAVALLSPSLAEGYGMPVAEALALGTSVLAANNPVYRELWSSQACLIDASDEDAWLALIRKAICAVRSSAVPSHPLTWSRHIQGILEIARAN